MFNYGNLTWTTGVLAAGSPVDGLGGNPAGVSRTPSVSNNLTY